MGVRTVVFMIFGIGNIMMGGEQSITGNFRWDLMNLNRDTVVAETSFIVHSKYEKKNPLLNGMYSLVLPGAGQFQTERYTKTAIFLTAEIAFIAYAIISNKNGDKKTEEFQQYAEAHWSAERYAKWINSYGAADYGPAASIDLVKVRQNDFTEINAWESASAPNKVGFSHQLPKFREQQYFELIGKYYQFKFGWDTYPMDANGVPLSDGKDYFNNYTADKQVKEYAANRGKANDYYYAASFALSALVINHVVSAFDGFFSAKSYNSEVSASLNIQPIEGIEGERLLSELTVKVGL